MELKASFSSRGWDFNQVYKDDKIVVFKKTRNSITDFELFKPKIHSADLYHDHEYEQYPADEDFGDWAWDCSSIGSVVKILTVPNSLGRLRFPDVDNVDEIIKLIVESQNSPLASPRINL